MNVNGKPYRTIWMDNQSGIVYMIDQNALPFEFKIFEAKAYKETCHAIITMITRGAGAIGAAAGFAMAQAFLEMQNQWLSAVSGTPANTRNMEPGTWNTEHGIRNVDHGTQNMEHGTWNLEPGTRNTEHGASTGSAAGTWNQDSIFSLLAARYDIESTRPTARNLFYATERVFNAGMKNPAAALAEAQKIAEENVADSIKIGEFGNSLIQKDCRILTHCNAGWLGFVDYGSALAPVYVAKRQGKDVFVYADETRPRNQGARLTAWELRNEEIPHCIVPDNAGAYLMSRGMIDMVITGADRIAANGDAANKIGTFEKAIVAKEFGIPFYIAVPFSTIDFSIPDGSHIKIEERSENEVLEYSGPDAEGKLHTISLASPGSHALNPAFDVTPAKYITAFITEKGILKPDEIGRFAR